MPTQPTSGLQRPSDQRPPSQLLPLIRRSRVGQHVGDVEPDGGDRRHGRVGHAAPQHRHGQEEGEDHAEPDGVGRRPRARVDAVPVAVTGHGAVAAEGEEHPGVRRRRRHAAEELRDHGDQQQQLRPHPRERRGPDGHRRRRVGGGRRIDLRVGGDHERDGQNEDPAGDQRDDDGADDPPGCRDVGVVGLLGHVRRGVVAREGVLRHQQPDHEDEPGDTERRLVLELREDEGGRGVVARHEEEHHGDGEDAENVPPGAHIGQEGDDPHTEAVDEAVDDRGRRHRR